MALREAILKRYKAAGHDKVERARHDLWVSRLSDDDLLEYEERSAIMEYDGGMSREESEKEARKGMCEFSCGYYGACEGMS